MQKIYTIAPYGLNGVLVQVEANLSRHLPKVVIVGLPDASVSEAKERVWAAIENSGFTFPRQKIVINLAPAQIRKEGGAYDLPIAVAILVAAGIIDNIADDMAFIGELSLNGELKAVPGVLVMVASLKDLGFKKIFVPASNAKEANMVEGIDIFAINKLSDLVDHLSGLKSLSIFTKQDTKNKVISSVVDMSDVRGQGQAKRVLEIAAAGGHNVLMIGPPGAGKTLLSKAFLSILPDMSKNQSLETSKIYSLAGFLSDKQPIVEGRIIRSPHHSASLSSIVGGGSWPRPGEISLAHNGVLFLDEILEFPRQVLESLRQPLEDKVITVSRIKGSLDFPANFILLATANPCPCGFLTDQESECKCSAQEITRYQKRLSGPVLDRIDLHIFLDKIKYEDLSGYNLNTESSKEIFDRVNKARKIQESRLKDFNISLNKDMDNKTVRRFCVLSEKSKYLLLSASRKLDLSARAYFKILKVARTIADLDSQENIEDKHVLEALQYRSKIFT